MRWLSSCLVGVSTEGKELDVWEGVQHIHGNMERAQSSGFVDGVGGFCFGDQEGSWRRRFGRLRFIGDECWGRDSPLLGVLTGTVASG